MITDEIVNLMNRQDAEKSSLDEKEKDAYDAFFDGQLKAIAQHKHDIKTFLAQTPPNKGSTGAKSKKSKASSTKTRSSRRSSASHQVIDEKARLDCRTRKGGSRRR